MNPSIKEHKDFFYSAVMLNTDINYMTIKELTDRKVITSYRDLCNRQLLQRIAQGEFSLSQGTVMKVNKLYDTYGKIETITDGYIKTAASHDMDVISCEDARYPYNWKVLCGMPKVFYAIGDYRILERSALRGAAAVVGSRNPGRYSLYATDQISRELADKGIAIVSGMAVGIDRQAHMSSYNAPGGTIAVLAGGADNIYPAANTDLYKLIRDNGLLISEMPPGQKPLRQYFPSRNRLIAGLSDCTLIMEAGEASGTLHTASFAAAQGKEVFVLPNNIYYDNAKGGLKLLEDGGNVLLSSVNVIDCISHMLVHKRLSMGRTDEIFFQMEQKDDPDRKLSVEMLREIAKVRPEALNEDQWKELIVDELTLKPLCADELCVITTLPFYKVSKMLTELELNGKVCQEKGKYSLTFV